MWLFLLVLVFIFRCLFEWQPHSGRPVSLIIFLDDLKNTSPEYDKLPCFYSLLFLLTFLCLLANYIYWVSGVLYCSHYCLFPNLPLHFINVSLLCHASDAALADCCIVRHACFATRHCYCHSFCHWPQANEVRVNLKAPVAT